MAKDLARLRKTYAPLRQNPNTTSIEIIADETLNWKRSASAASTDPVDLSGPTPLVVDNVTISGGNRVLLKNQISSSENGIYYCKITGTSYQLTRDTDAAQGTLVPGSILYVENGTTNQKTFWVLRTTGPIVVGTTGQSWQILDSGAGGGGGSEIFDDDFIVSLSDGKTFGRYQNGDTVPAAGKTPREVILLASQEPISPTVSFSSSTFVLFNQTSINNVLNFSYTINTLGATVSTVSLDWRRDGVGSWVNLSSNPSINIFTHSLTDTPLNTAPFNYRYTVVDSSGATKISYLDIYPNYKYFYGGSLSAPADETGIISLPQNAYFNTATSGTTFILNSGNTVTNFSVALPGARTITEVTDLDALNANITSSYVFEGSINVGSISYNLYVMTISSPYSDNHRHQITFSL